HVWTRDDHHAMFSLYDGSAAKLYDVREDPEVKNDIAGKRPGLVRNMFEDYVLKDAGGPLPHY
ncbi:MAG: sulfatase, partial [Actinomycetota bacterium]|nr:sulfatase [Actinomycetota bacterium]